jgi:uncharacterized membrane protein YadS
MTHAQMVAVTVAFLFGVGMATIWPLSSASLSGGPGALGIFTVSTIVIVSFVLAYNAAGLVKDHWND